MLVLGIDLGTSSVKVSVVDMTTHQILSSVTYPDTEAPIQAPRPGWAEQDPDDWWHYTRKAILKCHAKGGYDSRDIKAIGIAYQMHGLVLVDANQEVIRPAIIWCDSRAVAIGEKAFQEIGDAYCLQHLLNSPGNFTAAKLAWVKQEEPHLYDRIARIMLPGDFIAMRMTGEWGSTVSALSEGIFWDFRNDQVSGPLMRYFGFRDDIIPAALPVFSIHGELKKGLAADLQLKAGTPVTYKAGDQLNNALALSVTAPGQLAATGGTSGVLYGVSEQLCFDPQSRINSFAHVTHTAGKPRIGSLLCINGSGIFYKWYKQQWASGKTYDEINEAAATIPAGSEGLLGMPFGNGAERVLGNRLPGAGFLNLDLNKHNWKHGARATLEAIAFSFRYGFDIMQENGMKSQKIRAPKTNLFLSRVFTESLAGLTRLPVEFYEGDGSLGAAAGAWMGYENAHGNGIPEWKRTMMEQMDPVENHKLDETYEEWKIMLHRLM